MCKKSTRFIKSFDWTGVPVTLNLENKGVHQTRVGGCCSVIVIALTTIIITSQLITVFKGKTFNTQLDIEYIDESEELNLDNAFEVNSNDFIPALKYFNKFQTDVEMSNYLQPQAYKYVRVNNKDG